MTICYRAIDNCAGQFNRLDCDGNVLSDAQDIVVSCETVDITATPIPGEERYLQDPNSPDGLLVRV